MTDKPAGTGIGRVALHVNDLEEVATFYRTVLGLRRRDATAETVVLGTEEEEVLLLESAENVGERQSEEAGLYHVAFRVPSRPVLAAVLHRVEEEWRLDGAADHGVSEALYLTDPEGNGIEVYRDRPRAEWRETSGLVEMPTRPLDLATLRSDKAERDAVSGITVGHVHLEVTDLEKSRQFYVDVLGMQIRQELASALFVALDEYHHHVGLNMWRHRSQPAAGKGLHWFELILPGEEKLNTVRERCREHDIPVEEHEGGFAVTDPNGIQVFLRVL